VKSVSTRRFHLYPFVVSLSACCLGSCTAEKIESLGLDKYSCEARIALSDEEVGATIKDLKIHLVDGGNIAGVIGVRTVKQIAITLSRYNKARYPANRITPPNLNYRNQHTFAFAKLADSGVFEKDGSALSDAIRGERVAIGGTSTPIDLIPVKAGETPDLIFAWCNSGNPGRGLEHTCGFSSLQTLDEKIIELGELESLSGRFLSAEVAEFEKGFRTQSPVFPYGYSLWIKPNNQAFCIVISPNDPFAIKASALACAKRRIDVDAPLSVTAGTIASVNFPTSTTNKCAEKRRR
jgi:hypothetical protein